MAQKKRKLGAEKTSQKRACPAIPSKCLISIGILSPSVICLGVTPQQEIPNSPMNKSKKKATPIMNIIEAIVNTPWRNIRQAR